MVDYTAFPDAAGAVKAAIDDLYNRVHANEMATAALDARTAAQMAALDARLKVLEPLPNPFQDYTPVDGGTFSIGAGTFLTAKHIGVSQTVLGQGMRKTILDGGGGVGSGHRLAYGKGVVHVGGNPVVGQINFNISDIGFINGGGGDAVSDAEAGLYFELMQGVARVTRCAFDGGENGIFAAPTSRGLLRLLVSQSVFSRNKKTGVLDGKSHNNYVHVDAEYDGCLLFASNGHCVKSRGPTLKLTNNFMTRYAARWVDLPGGTDCVSSNNTYVTVAGASSNNAMGFYDESDTAVSPGFGSFISTDDTFYFSRPKVFWIGAVGATPPTVVIQGPGALTGQNPFIFNASNRVSAAPGVPADPVMALAA